MKKTRLIGGLAAAGAALFAAALLGGVVKLPAALRAGTPDPKAAVPLEFAAREVVQPARLAMPAVVEFSGPLVAPATAVVRAKAGGTLLSLAALEGQRVRAGQALGRIDLAEQGSRAVERAAGVEAARTALAQAERTHASNERLAAQQFISTIALDNSRAAVETARAQLAAAQAALETTRVGLRDAVLAAPIGGIVARRHVLPGEKVAPEQPVLTIVDLALLELAGRVGTHEVSRLAPGMPVEVRVEGVAQPVSGRIARIAPAAEPGTRAIGVAIEIANPQELYRAGQYALGRVVLADDTPRLTLPAAAVGQTGGQDHVWVIADGRLARRAVTLGRQDERAGRVEVLQGVAPADTVLAARFENLREGAEAFVAAANSAAVASAASSPATQR
jgi:RND family efflux transporter MFP subunit